MDREKIKKANNLQDTIDEYSRLLRNGKETYNFCLVKVNCANSNGYRDDYGRIERPVWNKMLDVLREEVKRLEREIDEL